MEEPAENYVTLFRSKVEKAPGGACWLWKGKAAKQNGGYGRAQLAAGKTVLAHRLAYVIAYGPLAPGECILHSCDTPLCVRPDHLFKGDRGDNARDMANKGRAHLQKNPRVFAGEQHWKRRHPEWIRRKPPRNCVNCGALTTVVRHGRCTPCAQYYRKHGIERPASLYLKARRRA